MSKDISEMTAAELDNHIQRLDAAHKRVMTTLRALARARAAEEAALKATTGAE